MSTNREFNLCACMGPQGDDPVCPCQMRSWGKTPTTLWTPEAREQLMAAFRTIAMNEEPIHLDRVVSNLVLATNSSCVCLTEMSDTKFHDEGCKYRLISESIETLRHIMSARQLT